MTFPMLHVTRWILIAAFNDGGRTGAAGRTGNRLRSVLIASELALARVDVGILVIARGERIGK